MKTLKSKAIADMGLSPRTLKEVGPELSTVLTSIYNHMLETETFPEKWMKIA